MSYLHWLEISVRACSLPTEPSPLPSKPQKWGLVGNLKRHQEEGVAWLIERYRKGCNVILGDEMGLGKTVQAIAFLLYLYSERKMPGPYLVICPLSVLTGWQQEFARFAPSLKVLTFHGDQARRDTLRAQIVAHIKAQPRDKWVDPSLPFHVLLVTYEIAIADSDFLQNFRFRYTVVDEAQRLKNPSSALYTTLDQKYMIPRRLLLTGTPLQNNVHELWSLLHFCNPKVWPEAQAFVHFFSSTSGSGAGHASGPGGPSGSASGASRDPPALTLRSGDGDVGAPVLTGARAIEPASLGPSWPANDTGHQGAGGEGEGQERGDHDGRSDGRLAGRDGGVAGHYIGRKRKAGTDADEADDDEKDAPAGAGLDREREADAMDTHEVTSPPQGSAGVPQDVHSLEAVQRLYPDTFLGSNTAGPSSPPPPALSWKQLVLRPFILRRRKSDLQAELSLPPLTKVTLYTKLSAQQRELYRSILRHNLPLLFGADVRRNEHGDHKAASTGLSEEPEQVAAPPSTLSSMAPSPRPPPSTAPSPSTVPPLAPPLAPTLAPQRLQNTVMQLRKSCSHPYLFEGQEPEPFEEGEHLVNASGKLVLLDAILTKLRRENETRRAGHAVLLYAQLTRTLDILQDYCSLRGIPYERLDGSVRAEERFAAIKAFSDSPHVTDAGSNNHVTDVGDHKHGTDGGGHKHVSDGDDKHAPSGKGKGKGSENEPPRAEDNADLRGLGDDLEKGSIPSRGDDRSKADKGNGGAMDAVAEGAAAGAGKGKAAEAPFVFLLSTRAGGVGLNLVKADTVIFFELDWNPQVDLQAQERCHRIGQTRPVLVLQLVTQGTLEEVILQRGRRKLKLAADIMGQHITGQPTSRLTPHDDGQGQAVRENRRGTGGDGDVDGDGDRAEVGAAGADDGMSRGDFEQMLAFGLHELESSSDEEQRAGARVHRDSGSSHERSPDLEEGCDESVPPGEGSQGGAAAASFLDEILAVRGRRKGTSYELVRGRLRPLDEVPEESGGQGGGQEGGQGGGQGGEAERPAADGAALEAIKVGGNVAVAAADEVDGMVSGDAGGPDDAGKGAVAPAIAATPVPPEADRPLDVYDFDGEGIRALTDANDRRTRDRRVFEEWCRCVAGGKAGGELPGEPLAEGRLLRSGKVAEPSMVLVSELSEEERAARERKREAAAAKRRAARWAELGYTSMRVQTAEERRATAEEGEGGGGGEGGRGEEVGDVAADGGSGAAAEEAREGPGERKGPAAAESMEEVEPAPLRFVVGDCTRPIAVGAPRPLASTPKGNQPNDQPMPKEGITEEGKGNKAMDTEEPSPAAEHKAHCVARAFVCSCVDNSGSWGAGGMFRALFSRWPLVRAMYEAAGAARDLHLGDVHLLPADDGSPAAAHATGTADSKDVAAPNINSNSPRNDGNRLHSPDSSNDKPAQMNCRVALLVVQECQKQGGAVRRGPVQLAALESALATLADAAVREGASVHLPRIGQGSSLSWYAVERIIRKRLCQRGVPVVVYYYRRQ